MRNYKLLISVLLFSLLCLTLTGCTSSQPVQPTALPTQQPTATATVKPTVVPTATPEPFPEILSILNDYYSSHQAVDEYQIRESPTKSYGDHEYTMSLVADEVPNSNGTAIVRTNVGSGSVKIDFQYSNFFGNDICSPSLIRAVSVATVKAIAAAQNLDNSDELVKAVIASYDESKYTSIVYVGDYAFSFKPKNIYATTLTAINCNEFKESFSSSKYETASYEDMSIQLNSGSEYKFEGTVKAYGNGQYRNSFASYKCLMLEVEMDDGKIVKIVQFPENVPISFTVGQKYFFYGTTMFDVSSNLLFYLHYAE